MRQPIAAAVGGAELIVGSLMFHGKNAAADRGRWCFTGNMRQPIAARPGRSSGPAVAPGSLVGA